MPSRSVRYSRQLLPTVTFMRLEPQDLHRRQCRLSSAQVRESSTLFLVDRGNLGKRTEDEFANFEAPDDPRKFPTPYTVNGSRRTLSIPRRKWSSPPNGS
jgi:hypothetical protein